jgi:hypothetical protein
MYPPNDDNWEEKEITEVQQDGELGFFLQMGDTGFYVKAAYPRLPQVGNLARFYTVRISTIRGLFINGEQFFYRTVEEQNAYDDAERENMRQEKIRKFEENRADHDIRIAALPKVFQKRLLRFQNGNPEFRPMFESYELMVCEQAVLIASHFKTQEELQEWEKLDYAGRKVVVPELDEYHSGNSMGCSTVLAFHYLGNPENVIYEHGALVPLVGCVNYGCTHGDEDAPS